MLKTEELRNLNLGDLREKLTSLSEGLSKLYYQKRMGRIDKPHQFKQIRKDIARIKTVMREKILNDKAS